MLMSLSTGVSAVPVGHKHRLPQLEVKCTEPTGGSSVVGTTCNHGTFERSQRENSRVKHYVVAVWFIYYNLLALFYLLSQKAGRWKQR